MRVAWNDGREGRRSLAACINGHIAACLDWFRIGTNSRHLGISASELAKISGRFHTAESFMRRLFPDSPNSRWRRSSLSPAYDIQVGDSHAR